MASYRIFVKMVTFKPGDGGAARVKSEKIEKKTGPEEKGLPYSASSGRASIPTQVSTNSNLLPEWILSIIQQDFSSYTKSKCSLPRADVSDE
ncbi:hypothetical protein MJO28_008960 [Puccinia striiformis f. sp. tritici]|uniref:Uncharacterized protein n=1 Tax=Puccinia striiformis f. sp. tritici TaxID=168172 RepID=A0ACC0ECF7_9BASI|nr:hypothetical protein MJO28_008960 [Puccinia striiformis f. sp. tritici]KAI7953189.1 hypothetical protein MJO29_008820 [Puccinia striiformis f. sp. tritici]